MTLLNFAINQEKHINKALKKLIESKSMAEKTRKSLKPVGTRPGVMYGSCKVHKASVGDCPPFRPILSALNAPTYKLAKFLEILSIILKNEILKASIFYQHKIILAEYFVKTDFIHFFEIVYRVLRSKYYIFNKIWPC